MPRRSALPSMKFRRSKRWYALHADVCLVNAEASCHDPSYRHPGSFWRWYDHVGTSFRSPIRRVDARLKSMVGCGPSRVPAAALHVPMPTLPEPTRSTGR